MSATTAVLPEGDWIRGISIKQPWATCILTGAKTVENRFGQRRPGWKPGWVLLHAGQRIDRPALRIPLVARTIRGRQMPTGAVVGVARITGCHQDAEGSPPCTEWAQASAWHLVLADVQELALPVPADGQLGPWKPSPDLVAQVFQQLPAFRP
ncbi:ASCH domain-containing protein [Streptomyces antimycoticus]|uniref:ASCH domain-containing protein n=1 Tax=Streptomyces antimycoticus TaxID=68175 RepID=UPI000A361DDC|nr:ASCH domain-containing protein [Streptomyces antimycoticus]